MQDQLRQVVKEDTTYKKPVDIVWKRIIWRYWSENNLLYEKKKLNLYAK
jgi:hypothetical protein